MTQSWIDAGVIVRNDGDRVIVEDRRWANIDHDAKVSIAIAAYCATVAGKPSKYAVIFIRGNRDGKIKASMVDGNYSD